MRRIWKWLGIGMAVLAGLALVGVLAFYLASQAVISRHYPLPPSHLRAATDSGAVARGGRLVAIYGCTDCHTRTLRGDLIPDFGVASRNLTRLAAVFSDADFDRAVRKGLRPDGTSVAEYMPSDAFRYMRDADMADILAYLRSLKPVGADIPFPAFDLKTRLGFLTGASHMDQYWFGLQHPALDLGPRHARGRELAMAACGECHMTALTGGPPELPGPRPPDLWLVASYERADFVKLMRTGKAAGNRELPLMSATARARFSRFSDDELNAVYDYLAARGRKVTGADAPAP